MVKRTRENANQKRQMHTPFFVEILKSLQQQTRALERNVSSQLYISSSTILGELMKLLLFCVFENVQLGIG